MHEIKVNLHDCKHCAGSGTCKNGKDGMSCLACARRNDLPFWKLSNQYGLLCGSCGGIGQAESLTERINKRIAPLLAVYLAFGILVLVIFAATVKSDFFSEILAFSSAIIGTVMGFYFSNRVTNS